MSIKANIFLIGQIVKSTPGAVVESAILAADLAIKNKECLSSMQTGNVVTVNGKAVGDGTKMLSEQGQAILEKELAMEPENAELLGIELVNPKKYLLTQAENLADNAINTPHFRNFKTKRVENLLRECDRFNSAYKRYSEFYAIDNSKQAFNLLTTSEKHDVGESDYPGSELSGSLDQFAIRYLTDETFRKSVESLTTKTYHLEEYVDNKLRAILLEKHKSEPIYEHSLESFKSLLRANNGDKVINRFLRSEAFSSDSCLKRFLPAIRNFKLTGKKSEEYRVLELLTSHKRIDKHIQEQLKIATDIPKSLLEHENIVHDELIVKLKREKSLFNSFKLLDDNRIEEAQSEYKKYAKQILNTEMFTYSVMLMPKEFKNDIEFVEKFSSSLNNKFLNNNIKLKADINKIEYEASMFSNSSPVDRPEYEETSYRWYDRIEHGRLHKMNWAINYDWRGGDIKKACAELDLLLAYDVMESLENVLQSSRDGSFEKANPKYVNNVLDQLFVFERMIPGAYLPGLIVSGHLNEEGKERVNEHIFDSGFYYQALILNEIKSSEGHFNETLTGLVRKLDNSNQMSLLQEKLQLFGVEQDKYKNIFLARVLEDDFKLFSKDSKEDYVMKSGLNEDFKVAYESLEFNFAEDDFFYFNNMFQRDSATGEMTHVLSTSLDKATGELKLAAVKDGVKVKVNGKWINSKAIEDTKIEIKEGDFISIDNNGKTDLYYVGFIPGQGPILNLAVKAKAKLFDSLVGDSKRQTGLRRQATFRSHMFNNLVNSMESDRSGAFIAGLLNSIESIKSKNGSSDTLVWTGQSSYIEHYVNGPCPHTVTYPSPLIGFQEKDGKIITHETPTEDAMDANQSHPFLKMMSTFMVESRSGHQGGAILPDMKDQKLLGASSQNSAIALNGAKTQNLLAPSKDESADLALSHVKELGLKYNLEKSVKAQKILQMYALKCIENSTDTFELAQGLKMYQNNTGDTKTGPLENVIPKLAVKFQAGEIEVKTTDLAEELDIGEGLPLLDEIAEVLEETGAVKDAKKIAQDFRSDKDRIFDALDILNEMCPQNYFGEDFKRAMDMFSQISNIRTVISSLYGTFAAKEKRDSNTIKPFLFSLYYENIDDEKQAIDPSIYHQICKEFSQKDICDQVQFLARVHFFRKDLDISDLIEEVTMKVNDSDRLSKILGEFKLNGLEDDLIREAFFKSASREDFIWNMSEEDAAKVLTSISNPYYDPNVDFEKDSAETSNALAINGDSSEISYVSNSNKIPLTIPESKLEFIKSVGEFDDLFSYDLFAYRDSEKKFLGSLEFDPSDKSLKYRPTNMCGDYPLEMAHVNGDEVSGTACVELEAGDLFQVADGTYYVADTRSGEQSLALVAKGNAAFIKTMFFDKNVLDPRQGAMPECAWSSLISNLLKHDKSAGIKRKIFEGIALGYDYRNEPAFRIRLNSHDHTPKVPLWKQRVDVVSGMNGAYVSVDENNNVSIKVERPFLATRHQMELGYSGSVIPMSYYHGGSGQGSPAVSLYGLAAKEYIGSMPYEESFPQQHEIVQTFWEDPYVEGAKEVTGFTYDVLSTPLDELMRDIEEISTITEFKTSKRNVDYEKANPALKTIFKTLYFVHALNNPGEVIPSGNNLSFSDISDISINSMIDRPTRRIVKIDEEKKKEKQAQLDSVIAEYEKSGELDLEALEEIYKPTDFMDEMFGQHCFSYGAIKLAANNPNSKLIITGTNKGKEQLTELIKKSSTPGEIGTFGVLYNRLPGNLVVPEPDAPLADLRTPIRSLHYKIKREHAYMFQGIGPDNKVYMNDGYGITRSIKLDEFTRLYSTHSSILDRTNVPEESVMNFNENPS